MLSIALVQYLREHVMHETQGQIEARESGAAFSTPRISTRPITRSMTAKAELHTPPKFESVLLAIDPVQVRQRLSCKAIPQREAMFGRP